jgi:hypothetical protein
VRTPPVTLASAAGWAVHTARVVTLRVAPLAYRTTDANGVVDASGRRDGPPIVSSTAGGVEMGWAKSTHPVLV